MPSTLKVVSVALSFSLFFLSAKGLQKSPTSSAQSEPARGTVAIYDSNGKLISAVDEAGKMTRTDGTQPASVPQAKPPTPNIPALAPVTINVPADQPTIQAAIDAAHDGDLVLVAEGTYKENIDFKGKAISVGGLGGASRTIIDGGGLDTVVSFRTGETRGSLLSGFTITNGFANPNGPNSGEGGGIFVSGASPIILSSVIENNKACEGAGIAIAFGAPLIEVVTISNNVQGGCSGGIGGAGISIRGESSGTAILGNTIANNSIAAGGGGISLFAAGGPLILSNNFIGNNGGSQGGGIAIFNDASPQIMGNVFIHNTASQGGGLYWLIPQSTPGILLLGNTISDNSATHGSGIFSSGFSGNASLQNNIILGQAGASAIFCESFNGNTPPGFVANDVFTTGATPYGGICTDQTGTSGNISSDPLFVDPSADSLRLQPSSPAVDAGNNTARVALPFSDIDRNPRVFNTTIDIGAYEYQGATTTNFNTTSLTYRNQKVGTTSAAQTVSITNTGPKVLWITPFVITGDFIETNDCHTDSGIFPGRSCSINISFAPTTHGTRTGQLTITSNDVASPTAISLSGVGGAPVVNLSAPNLGFIPQLVGSTSLAQSITLRNLGDEPLVNASFVTSGDFGQSNDCGASVAIGGSCTVDVTFTPTLRGVRNGTLTITYNASGSPNSVALGGTGFGPAATLGATSLTFSGQLTGTTSVAQTVTLTSSGETDLNISSLAASGDFTPTMHCGATVPPGQSCTIQIAFAPTSPGLRNGTVTIADNSTSSPEHVNLSGTGTDFNVGTQPGGASSATVNAGGAANYNLSLSGTAGATGSVTLSCSGAPVAATCSVNPASVNLNGTTPANFTVTVSTTSRASLLPAFRNPFGWPTSTTLLLWASATALLLIIAAARRRRWNRAVFAPASLGLTLLLTACGGGTPPPPPPPHGTPAGTSTVVVTATSGTATRTFNLTLNVN